MAFQADFFKSRTWDEERGLELVVTTYRVATEYRIKKGEDVLIKIDTRSSERDLTDEEKRENPGVDQEITWHISRYWPNDHLLSLYKRDERQLILEAFTAYQGCNGVAGFKKHKPFYALVRVKFGSTPRAPELY